VSGTSPQSASSDQKGGNHFDVAQAFLGEVTLKVWIKETDSKVK